MKKQSQKRQAAAKPLRVVQTSRHLRVTPHSHTGHRLPGRTTSYPMLAMIVLCVGVFLVGWTRFVTAAPFVYPGPSQASYQVNASVPAPAPTQAATIDTPNEGDRFSSLPINVSGTCPADTYVTLYRNGTFSGVALCQANGTYSLQTGLFVGNNQLQAQVFSSTDVPGPMSNSVTVVYAPPVQPTLPGAANSATPTDPLIFKTDFNYTGHYTGKTSTWRLDISGGNPPYAIFVDWGDGTTSLISRLHAGVFSIDHTYKKAGGYKGSYVIRLKASDTQGAQTFLQLLTIVNNPPSATGTTSKSNLLGGGPDTTQTYLQKIFDYVWPSYGLVVLMLTSFWLGERRELKLRIPRHKKARHRHA